MDNYLPLFEPGFHDISLEHLTPIFVEPFNDSSRREFLTSRLIIFLEQLGKVGIHLEVWVDGSYATSKKEPNDVDIAIFYSPDDILTLSEVNKRLLINLVDDHDITKLRYGCDIYFLPNTEINGRSYWRGWFGFTRNEVPKGIPRVNISQ